MAPKRRSRGKRPDWAKPVKRRKANSGIKASPAISEATAVTTVPPPVPAGDAGALIPAPSAASTGTTAALPPLSMSARHFFNNNDTYLVMVDTHARLRDNSDPPNIMLTIVVCDRSEPSCGWEASVIAVPSDVPAVLRELRSSVFDRSVGTPQELRLHFADTALRIHTGAGRMAFIALDVATKSDALATHAMWLTHVFFQLRATVLHLVEAARR